MSFKVRIAQADRTIEVPTGATILEAALDAGVPYPYGCQSGNCGACKSHLVTGEVEMSPYSDFALTDEEKAHGQILACRAVPRSECEVAWLEADDMVVHPRRILTCTVAAVDDVTHDIKRVRLSDRHGRAVHLLRRPVRLGDLRRPPAARLFDGQHAGRHDARVPRPAHARRRDQRRMSSEHLKVGDRCGSKGPSGTSYLRESHRGPIIAVAGGSGLAPIKSIVETALKKGMKQGIHLYFGVRDERDLYLEDHFKALADQAPELPVHAGAERSPTAIPAAHRLRARGGGGRLRRSRRLQGLSLRPAGHGRGGVARC